MSSQKQPNRTSPKFLVRYSEEDRKWLSSQAKLNRSSQNSEIIRAIRERRERVQKEAV